jgi:hypothetical protein
VYLLRRLLDMLRGEHRARAFLLTYAQSSLGTGAAIVALFVIAYQREPSPWAIRSWARSSTACRGAGA